MNITGMCNKNILAPNIATKRFWCPKNIAVIILSTPTTTNTESLNDTGNSLFLMDKITIYIAKGSLANNNGVARAGKNHFLKAPSKINKKKYIQMAFLIERMSLVFFGP